MTCYLGLLGLLRLLGLVGFVTCAVWGLYDCCLGLFDFFGLVVI